MKTRYVGKIWGTRLEW